MLFLSVVLILLHSGLGAVYLKQLSDRVITTRYGKVRGILVEFPNRHLRAVEAYLGLRYADLDEGGMRFMPPKHPKDQWNGIRVLIKHQPVCPQPVKHEREYSQHLPEARVAHLRNITPYLSEQKEDCLTLNLYVPIQEWNNTAPMAVVVFIHGESYETGTGNAYDGSVLASYGDVIVVTVNYRLGVLGFLTTEDHTAMGNYALMDITQALLWLKENIASFNGDPLRVTLLGHGTGAALVNLLMLSPFMSDARDKYFQRAILQSGSALSSWATSYNPRWCMEKVALGVNCSNHLPNTQALIHCLRERNIADLINAVPQAPKYFSCFAPTFDWAMLPRDVRTLLRDPKSKFATVPIMFGVTKNEAYAYLKQDEIKKGVNNFRKAQLIRSYVQNVFKYHRQKIYEVLEHHYTDWTHASDHLSNRDSVLELLGDGLYVAPLMEVVNQHELTADSYLYSFSYSTISESEDAEHLQGIHGDELPYVFGSPLVNGSSPFPPSYTNTERMLSEAVMTYWTNFAKTGNPNSPREQTSVHGEKVANRFVDLEWPKYKRNSQEYLPIDLSPSAGRRPAVRNHYRAQKLALWLDLIPKLHKNDGSEPAAHLLDHFDNASTYDDFDRLIPSFHNTQHPTFKSPGSPLLPFYIDGPGTSQTPYLSEVTDDDGLQTGNRLGGQNTHNSSIHCHTIGDPRYHQTAETPNSSFRSETGSGVPLSIVIAIGGSLLLINILIFAGLCYQRERMRKMRKMDKPVPPSEIDFEEARFRKLDSNRSSPCPAGGVGAPSECLSLMSGASSSHAHSSPAKHSHRANSHVHIPSPQPSLHSRRAQSLSRSNTPLEITTCNYSPVPTHVVSPVHRTHIGVSSGGGFPGHKHDTHVVNSKVRTLPDVAYKTGEASGSGLVTVVTVGDGVSSFTAASSHPGVPTPVTSSGNQVGISPNTIPVTAVSSSHTRPNENEEPVYKTINKSGHNNAVTVV